jgi:hypothetical protein
MKPEDKIRLVTAIVIPLAIVWLGYLVESSLGSKEKLVEERIQIYEKVGPLLNDIYVHVQHVGHYKEMNDEKAIESKRKVDKLMYSNQAFFSTGLFEAYREYMESAFKTFRGEGLDAKPKEASRKHKKSYRNLMEKFHEEFK